MLEAAPAFANQGVYLCCSAFTRVIVGLLVEAQAPELKHLWVFANDEPGTERKRWKADDRNEAEPGKEDRYRNERDGHPCRQAAQQLRVDQGIGFGI